MADDAKQDSSRPVGGKWCWQQSASSNRSELLLYNKLILDDIKFWRRSNLDVLDDVEFGRKCT
ncbi:hypothetical protein M569_17745 [Genlisea aurea]|uniref:Uncharacterized protein n=1 Tax=Genlisea aurea TaxID=192259 RepID=S8BR26_9LAMI|nr:hypothetical protein M569_17745 [Genlisea aurea]